MSPCPELGNSRAIQRRLHLWQTLFPTHPSCLPNLDIHYKVCRWMQHVLPGHSFFRTPPLSIYIPSSHLHLFFLPLILFFFAFSVWVQFLLFLLSYCGLKDAEQHCNKGGSALIKYSNLLSSPFCCGDSTAKIDEPPSDTQEAHYIYIWGWLWWNTH